MTGRIYAEGYETGQATASLSEKAILNTAGKEALGSFCGKRIAELTRRAAGHDLSVAWTEGFFDGWMDRAERIIGSRDHP